MLYFRAALGTLIERSAKRLQRLASLTECIDQEAIVLEFETIELRHQEVLSLLPLPVKTMLVGNLPYHNLPYSRNPAFYSRQQEFQKLVQHLRPGSPPDQLLAVGLHGLGGVGKTEIALEYTYRFIDDYDAIIWMMADTTLKLTHDLTKAARGIGVVQQSSQQPSQICEALKLWLFTAGKRSMFNSKLIPLFKN